MTVKSYRSIIVCGSEYGDREHSWAPVGWIHGDRLWQCSRCEFIADDVDRQGAALWQAIVGSAGQASRLREASRSQPREVSWFMAPADVSAVSRVVAAEYVSAYALAPGGTGTSLFGMPVVADPRLPEGTIMFGTRIEVPKPS